MVISDQTILDSLDSTVLFYPCSGKDLRTPIELFTPTIREYWFADLNYFNRHPMSQARPVLHRHLHFKLSDVQFSGPDIDEVKFIEDHRGKMIPDITPGIRTEFYEHLPSGKIVVVHRRRGYGFSALKAEIMPGRLGVFFYRGDSDKLETGGSGTLWLSARPRMKFLFGEVLDRLVDGGLIVTDGSNCDRHNNPYSAFCRFRHQDEDKELFSQPRFFADHIGNRFDSVQYLFDQDHAATFVWRVTKSTP